MSTNGVSASDESDMTGCDGEKVVTMMDVLKEQEEFEEDANAVLGASDDKECTYPKGYIKRQAIYACLTCCPEAKNYNTMRAGVCLACSLNCHENHELIELYTKRNFRCDCGNPKFNSNPCQYVSIKADLNKENSYNQNFSGLYCTCNRPYPDPECTIEDEMIQCIICEDWLHSAHLEAAVPSNELYSEMICKGCMDKNEFLHDYSDFAVNNETECVDVVNVSCVDEASINAENGSSKSAETINEENNMDVDNAEGNKASDSSENEKQNKTDDTTNTSEVNSALVETEKVSENIKEQLKSTDDHKPEDSEKKDINESLSPAECDNHIESTKDTSQSADKKYEEPSNINSDNKTINTESEKLTTDEQTKGEIEQENNVASSQEDKRTSIEETSIEKDTKETTEDVIEKEKNEATLNTDNIDDTKMESSENKTDSLTESVVKDDSNVEIDKENSTENNAVANDMNSSKTNGHTEESPTKNDSEVKTICPENKRKLSTVQPETEEVSSKKVKLDEKSSCTRPKGVKSRFKGATFWPSNFREKLCTCNECISMYKDLSVLFIIDPEDTVTAYEMLGKQMIDGAASQYEKGLEALSSLDRIQQINALTEYNKMRDKLLDFLKSFKDRKEIVKEEDIKAFFAGMKPKREPDGVYFCR